MSDPRIPSFRSKKMPPSTNPEDIKNEAEYAAIRKQCKIRFLNGETSMGDYGTYELWYRNKRVIALIDKSVNVYEQNSWDITNIVELGKFGIGDSPFKRSGGLRESMVRELINHGRREGWFDALDKELGK